MPKKSAAEFSWIESKQLYRKRVKNPYTGKWHDIYGRTKDETRAKIKATLERWQNEAEATENPFVYEYCQKWYTLNTSHLTTKGRKGVANCINNHICPYIGGLKMRDVRLDDVKSVMAACSQLSYESQRKVLNALKGVFSSAVTNKIIPETPVVGIKPSGRKPKEKEPLTRAQQERLLSALKGTTCGTFVAIGLYSGLRREEILGLKWDCVHLDADPPYITVQRALTWEGNRPVVKTELKSEAARRDIPAPPQLVEHLRGIPHAESEHVVADVKGMPMSQSAFRSMWRAVETRTARIISVQAKGRREEMQLHVGDIVGRNRTLISLDFHVTPHQLRHTYITELVLSGANIKTVQYLAGHSAVQMTLRVYAHLLDKQPRFTQSAVLQAFAPDALGGKEGVKSSGKIQQSIDIQSAS